MRYWSTAPHESRDVTEKALARHIAAPEPTTYFVWDYKGHVIGMGGAPRGGHEIGYILAAAHWRKGFAREAMNAILPEVWRVTDHPHLIADADPLNVASTGFLESLGFHETHRAENTFCINGVWSDSVYYRLDRPV